ncbi:MAG: putative quinol monooxygenase [Jatrophihabitans sp.]
MAEISTVAVITAKPGSGPAVEAALRELAVATHAEPDCILYSLQRGLADPNVFVTVEKWVSQEALDAHLASPHVATALGLATEHLGAPLQIIATEPLDAGDIAKRSY